MVLEGEHIMQNAHLVVLYLTSSVQTSSLYFDNMMQTQLSPLAPGQWPKFLAVYAGFWAFNNVVRPARFACSMLVTPYFDRTVSSIQRKLRCSKGRAIGIVVFLANFCGTLLLMSVGIFLAASASGVPIFPKRA